MPWFVWILIVVFVILPFVLFCYSAIATSIEIGRKVQPFVDYFFDFVAALSGYRRPRTDIENVRRSKRE